MLTFTNARVFDGRALLPGRQVVTLDGDRIASVAQLGTAPSGGQAANGQTIDLDGMTLMPGLITSHFHPDFYRFTLAEGLAGEPLGKELPPGVLMAIGVRNCRVLLESGFTGYVGAGCGHDIDAQLKMAIARGIIPGPRIRACSPHIGTTGDLNDSKKWWRRFSTPGTDVFADGPDELRKLVRDYTRRGCETIKIFAGRGHGFPSKFARNMDSDEIAAIVQAAHGRGAKVRAHVCEKAMILECIALGVDIIDHGDDIDAEIIAAMVEAGTCWLPSLIYPQTLLRLGWGNAEMQARYDTVRAILPFVQAAGVRILIGDDYSSVFEGVLDDNPLGHEIGSYGRELEYYGALEGLSPAQVLAWGTANAGELLAAEGETLGVVTAGAVADLIVIDGDPLTDLSLLARPETALKAVIRDGVFAINRLAPTGTRMETAA
jgi:imidazolonepropionase-like amidohydrolase